MLKHILLLVVVSTLAILFRSQLVLLLDGLIIVHNAVASWLGIVFSGDAAGRIIQAILALIVIPIIAASIAALIFWMIKRVAMPHLISTVWVAWGVMLITMLAQSA